MIDQHYLKKKEFTICGTINEKFTTYYPPPKLIYRKNQYLSSHLQKCIRRSLVQPAIQIAINPL